MRYNAIGIGNRIFVARKNKGLKQAEICMQLGIGQSTYSYIETGRKDINLPVLFALSEILDVSISWIIGDDSEDFTNDELLEIEKYKKYIRSLRNNP